MELQKLRGNVAFCPGEKHAMAKLTWKQVCTIRRRHADGVRISRLANDYGVSQLWIGKIVRLQARVSK